MRLSINFSSSSSSFSFAELMLPALYVPDDT